MSSKISDAASARPVCNDTLAARFLTDDARRGVEPLLRFQAAASSNVARHRIIDDLLRAALAQDAVRRVILAGAGFDTRAFRLPGGRWWELDDRELLAFKEQRLPAVSAPNPLTRVPVSFESETLASHLEPLGGNDPALVVIEGVTMYLADETLESVARAVRTALPRATLICDIMTPAFARSFSRGLQMELARMGASFGPRREQPRRIIERAGYTVRTRHSIPGRAAQAGSLRIPRWVLATVLRGLRDGYMVHVFEPGAPR